MNLMSQKKKAENGKNNHFLNASSQKLPHKNFFGNSTLDENNSDYLKSHVQSSILNDGKPVIGQVFFFFIVRNKVISSR